MKFFISEATIFDEDEQLWFTKVGSGSKSGPLHYTVWGKDKEESRQKARELVAILQA